MAKGDMKSRLMAGQQPGLPPMIGTATSRDNSMAAISPSPEAMQHIMPVAPPVNTPTQPIEATVNGSARMMPMQSGTALATGKHPIGTNKQRMLRYNSPTGY